MIDTRNENPMHEKPIGSALWRAGAGAGKTYNLVLRVMRMAEVWASQHGGEFPRVVVTTFTRKATQELRERLMEAALKRAADGDGRLVPFVTSRSSLFVTTMHGVMDSYLRAFGSRLGLEAGFRVGAGDEIETLARRVSKGLLLTSTGVAPELKEAADVLLTECEFSQALTLLRRVSRIRRESPEAIPLSHDELVTAMVQELTVLAPGLLRLAQEIERKSSSAKWQLLTEWLYAFAKELEEIDALTAAEKVSMWLDSEPKVVNAGGHKIVFESDEWKAPISAVKDAFETFVNEAPLVPTMVATHAALLRLEGEFSKRLAAEKIRAGLIEIEDLELLALQLAREHPDTAKAFSENWDHWLIDEYQDTSPRQVTLIRALAGSRPQFIVGDPQQSIYLFRGARPGVFNEQELKAKDDGREHVVLDGNWRSDDAVMAFINSAVTKLGSEFRGMRPEPKKSDPKPGSIASPFGPVRFLALEPRTVVDDKGKIKNARVDEQRQFEAEVLSRAIERIWRAGASPSTIVVLARSNKDLAIVAQALGRKGVPLQVHTSGAYADRLEISDLCALLSFLTNPHDDANLIHLARTPWFPLDESILAEGFERKTSLWSVIETGSGRESDAVEVLRVSLLAARERGVVQAFREALISSDFFSWCGALDASGRREANALKFLSLLAVAERQAGFQPRRFVDEILGGGDWGQESEASDRDAVAAVKPDRVSLMTVHASKGLEFDHVFLPFLGQKGTLEKTPSEFVFHEERQRWSSGIVTALAGKATTGPLGREWTGVLRRWSNDEAARVLYVAMTRARKSLFLSAVGDPDDSSFLARLRLSRTPGEYGSYAVSNSLEIDDVVAPQLNAEVRVRMPFGKGGLPEGAMSRDPVAISVTRLLELEDEQASGGGAKSGATLRTSTDSKRALSMAVLAARGTRLHRVFELAKPRAGGVDQELLAAEIVRWFEDPDLARKALHWILELKEPNLSAVLANGEVEWGFTYLRQNQAATFAIDGQIDLWGRDERDRLWVIDYKTGDPRYRDKAFRQLRYYAEALVAAGRASADETLSLAALYPFAEKVFTETWTVDGTRES